MTDEDLFRKVGYVCYVLSERYDVEYRRTGEHKAQITLQDYSWDDEEHEELEETINKHGIKLNTWLILPDDDKIRIVLDVVAAEAGK